MDNEYCLAMYDVRGKQNYVFRNSHLKEIVGASAIIRDIFSSCLFDAAISYRKEKGIQGDSTPIINLEREKKEPRPFSSRTFIADMKKPEYIGEMIYDGGGNFFVLFKNRETVRRVNEIFTKKVLEETDTLKVISSYIEDVDFNDYRGDRNKLYDKHAEVSAKYNFEIPSSVLPIIQVDNGTSMPLSRRANGTANSGSKDNKVSYESYAKLKKYDSLKNKGKRDSSGADLIEGVKFLDDLVEDKGNESLLAIVYIDGNNMGAQIQKVLDGLSTYEECIKKLREFSREIQTHFVENGIAAINRKLKEKYKKDKVEEERRIVVFAGDEINFIVNARDAYDAVIAFFDYLKGVNESQGTKYSACAGISIFHSHSPYSDAYRIAEECCESGKRRMKDSDSDYAFYVDYEYNQGAIGLDLDLIREKNGEIREFDGKKRYLYSKPWLHCGDKEELYTTRLVSLMKDELNKISRSNVKTLVVAAKASQNEFSIELQRIKAHSKEDLDFTLGLKDFGEDKQRRLIYDVGIVFDIWFRKRGKADEE